MAPPPSDAPGTPILSRVLAALGLVGVLLLGRSLILERRESAAAGERSRSALDGAHGDTERTRRELVREREAHGRELARERTAHARELERRGVVHQAAMAERVVPLQAETERLAASRSKLSRERDLLLVTRSDLTDERNRLLTSHGKLTTERRDLRVQIEDLEKEIAGLSRSGATAERILRDRTTQLAALRTRLTAAEREAGIGRDQLARLEQQLARFEKRLADPLKGPLADAARARVRTVLEQSAGPLIAVERLGRSAWVLPFLTPLYADPELGTGAVKLSGELDGVDVSAILAGVADSERMDRDFVRAAAVAIGKQFADTDRAAGLKMAHAHPVAAVRLVALEAVAALAPQPCLAALEDPVPEVVELALDRLAEAPRRHLLVEALDREDALPVAIRVAAWKRLLASPDPDLCRLAGVVVKDPAIQRVAIPEAQGRALLGELLAMPQTPDVVRVCAFLLGMKAGEDARGCWRAAAARGDLAEACVAAARRPGLGDAERAELAALLPMAGTSLEPVAVAGVVPCARPAHVPFLLASIDALPPGQRLIVAEVLCRFGHARGAAVIVASTRSQDPSIRRRAVLLAGKQGLEEAVELAIPSLADEDQGVRLAALLTLDVVKASLPLDDARAALSWADPAFAPLVLAALERHPDVARARAGLLSTLGRDGGPLASDAVARWLFAGSGMTEAACSSALHHPSAAVRARALEALCGISVRDRAARARMLMPLVSDPDFRVRVHAARALGGVRHALAQTALSALANDGSPQVRDVACRELAGQARELVVPALRRGVRDADPWVRNAARLSLLAHGMNDEAKTLLDDLAHPILGLRTLRALDRILEVDGKGNRDVYLKALARSR